MKNTLEKLEWIWDYYFVYFLYNPNKMNRYHKYMLSKWNLAIEPTSLAKTYIGKIEISN